MDGAMGQEEDVVEAVLTCEGDFHDPELNSRIERFRHRLKDLLLTEKHKLHLKKVEPWNSVKVTFTIPRDAAIRLRQLAQNGNEVLRQMGVRSVQIQGDSQISLTIAGHSSELAQVVLQAPPTSQASNSAVPLSMLGMESASSSSEEFGLSPRPINDELTRKNIMDYFMHGPALRNNTTLYDTTLGSGAAAVSPLGMGLGVSQPLNTMSGPSGSNAFFRLNNTAMPTLQNQSLGRSPINSSFSFTKNTGAFHPPVPRLSSAGQSSVTNTTQFTHSSNTSSSRIIVPLAQETTNSQANFSNTASAQGSTHGLNPSGSARSSSTSPNTNFNPQFFHAPASPSPSSFLKDLPPPPPYPHKSSSLSQLGKTATSSSPLLINLLQTDPLAAAALLASDNTNKSPIARSKLSGSSPKKKRRTKHSTEGLVKPYLLHDSASGCKIACHPHLLASNIDDRHDAFSYSEHTISESASDLFSVDLVHPNVDDFLVGHMQDSLISGFHTDSKSLFLPDYPVIESHISNTLPFGFHSDSSSRSAIRAECSRSKLSDSKGQKTFTSDLDPFSKETTAGKIINPYTGQLEPRDSVDDSGHISIRDYANISQGDNIAAQKFAKNIEHLEETNKFCVPNSNSLMSDVNVSKTAIRNPVSFSTCTAAITHSGKPLQAFSDMPKFISSNCSSLISNMPDSEETNGNTLSLNIYAAGDKQWQKFMRSSDVNLECFPSAVTKSLPMKTPSSASSTYQNSFAVAPIIQNGPVPGGHGVKHSTNPLHHHVVTSTYTSGANPASVIYSSTALSSSSSCHVSNQARITVAPVSDICLPTPFTSQNSAPISHTSQLGSSFTSLHLTVAQTTEKLRAAGSRHLSTHQRNQAASSDKVWDVVLTPKLSSPHLLNSLPDKHRDSQSPLEHKASSEGDENSNHSGIITDTFPEQSGTTALLEHSGVKTENHDSGVGSSSERSDDTPSEPGDGEFRSGQIVTENEDIGRPSQRTVNCKLKSKVNSNSNTATVGYTVNSNTDCALQPKQIQANASSHAMLATASSGSHVFHPDIKLLDKQTVQTKDARISSVGTAVEGHSCHSYTGNLRDNGPFADDMNTVSSVKMNGPSFRGNIEKVTAVMGEIQHKKIRSLPKHKSKKGLMDVQTDHLKLQAEVLEKMSKLHQFAESAQEVSDMLIDSSILDKPVSPNTLVQRLKASDDKPEQLIFDMEELVNGRTMGHSVCGIESKGGSNITSIYSKRSSPINVNMLNHIYAPGLPLPRRLTESVQRLVKPLPASESSVTAPQMRLSKFPASGGSPRSGSSNLISMRMSGQSGVRSPGASVPKLGSNDKHSLLSGGLDLAGVSSLHAVNAEQATLTTAMGNCKGGSSVLTQDMFPQDYYSLSSQNSPSSFQLFSGKILSHSFPPNKFKDFSASASHTNHDMLLCSSSLEKNNHSLSIHTVQHNVFSKSRNESLPYKNSKLHTSDKHQDSIHGNHVSSPVLDTGQTEQTPTPVENSHSSSSTWAVENVNVCTSHSSAPSPVMPDLQQGQEPPLSPTLSSSIPNTSSQPLLYAATENPPISFGSIVPLRCETAPNKHVPYSNILANDSNMAVIATTIAASVFASLPMPSEVLRTPPPLGRRDSPSFSAPPTRPLSSTSASSPPKLKKVCMPNNPPPPSSLRCGSHVPHFGRNLFESVSGTMNHEHVLHRTLEQPIRDVSVDQACRENPKLASHSSSSDSFSSILASQGPQTGMLVRNVRHKSTDGEDKGSTANVTHTGQMVVLKAGTTAKPVHISHSTSQSAETAHFDFSKTSLTYDSSYLNKDSNRGKSPVKTNNSSQESYNLQPVRPSASSPSSVSGSDTCLSHLETSSTLPSATSTSGMLLVKDPILETLASALASTSTKTSQFSSARSLVGRQSSVMGAGLELQKIEEDAVNECTILSTQWGSFKSQDYSRIQASVEMTTGHETTRNSETFKLKLIRKRKCTHNEEGGDVSCREASPPEKRLRLVESLSFVTSSVSSPIAEPDHTKVVAHDNSDGGDESEKGHDRSSHSNLKASANVTRDMLEKEEEDKCHSMHSSQADDDDNKDDNLEISCRISTSESKEQASDKEHDHCQSATSCKDESLLNSSPSCHGNGLAHREISSHHISTGDDHNEECRHDIETSSTPVDDNDMSRSEHSHIALSVHLEGNSHNSTLHKSIIYHHGIAYEHDVEDGHHENHSNCLPSAGDQDGVRSGNNDSLETNAIPDGDLSDSKLDDGLRKGHRTRRQFYAYVPEQSLDQTYFDTPILTGRTRSKNKPNDLSQDAVPVQDEPVLVASAVEAYTHHSLGVQQLTTCKTDGSTDGLDGKRPTRSLRTKDNPQENSTNKRRRVQHR